MGHENKAFIPYGRQSLSDDDIEAVVGVLKSDMWTTGPVIPKLEAKISELFDVSYSVSCSSGTAGLHLVSLAAGLDHKSLVIVPNITFVATANGPRYSGAKIYISDVDAETGLLTPELLKTALDNVNQDVAAVFVVHLAGRAADVYGIREVLDAHPRAQNCIIIEDACHAFGTYDVRGKPIGSCSQSDYCIFSLHPVKTIAAGEGGIVTTNHKENSEKLRLFRSHGITRDQDDFVNQANAIENGVNNPWYYEAQTLGYNYRLTDIQAGLALSQINRLSDFISKRQKLIDRYSDNLKSFGRDLQNVIQLTGSKNSNLTSWHLCVCLIDFAKLGISKNELMMSLRELNIGTQVHYIPLHLQPTLADSAHGNLNGSINYYNRCISLPLYFDLCCSDVDFICDTIISILKKKML